MIQIPSQDWPRRTNPLVGTEDLLKQNPSADAYPQEERVPVDLVSDYTIDQITLTNVGTGIGVFDFKNIANFDLRSFAAGSNKVSVGLNTKTITINVNPTNIAAEIGLTDLSNVSSPSNSNEYLMWNGSSFVFSPINTYAITITDYLNQSVSLANGGNFYLYGNAPIYVTKQTSDSMTVIFDGVLDDLDDVIISGSVPNGYILAYESATSKWKPAAPSSPSTYSFNIKGDDISSSNVINSATVSILGDSTITSTLTGTNEITIGWSGQLSDLSDVSNISPSNNQVLTYNTTTSKWEPKATQNPTITANNGITYSSNTIKLGGVLNQTTVISGNSTYPISFISLQKFEFNTNRSGHTTLLNSNMDLGITELKNTKDSNSNNYKIALDSVNEFASLEVQNGTSTKKFKHVASLTESALFYEFGGSQIAGFKAQENKIIILDGVNTPSAGHVLTFMSTGAAQWQPVSGGGLGDDWGNQVIERDSSLTGDGTTVSPLSVTNAVPGSWNEDEYLTIVGGVMTWQSFPREEYVGLCEIDKDSDVSILEGKAFFTVPPQMNGWEIKSYIASVYVLGSGGTTDVELLDNGTPIVTSATSMSSQYQSVSSVNHTINTGDRISINITGVKTVKDKGLSVTLLLSP